MRTFSEELILLIADKVIIGVIILVAAYFLNKYLEDFKAQNALRQELQTLRDQTRLKHLQQQTQELYSPLLGLIQYLNVVKKIYQKKMSSKVETGLVKEYFREKYFLPLNSQIANLIRTKIYLIASNEIPDSFVRFLSYQAQYESLHMLYVDKKIKSEEVTPEPYPPEFEQDVKQTLDNLRQEYNEYITKLTKNR